MNAFAQRIFDGISGDYYGSAQVLSLFQYGRWHRSLVSRLNVAPGGSLLDVCTGTGRIACRAARGKGCRVVGVDLSLRMLKQGKKVVRDEGLDRRVSLVGARAEDLPFADGSFDAVMFSFLLRYVDDPQATLSELARVLRPGGQMCSLEFYTPRGLPWYPLWLAHTRLVIPLGTRLLSPEWSEVGSFLGPSISSFYRKHSLPDLMGMWERAGVGAVQAKTLSLGGAVVMWGRKEATGEDRS
jgi:demethylmenaquinone methyltransferase/2-methoxy-6-polyprenyl-1,4-benzoquinol methylase